MRILADLAPGTDLPRGTRKELAAESDRLRDFARSVAEKGDDATIEEQEEACQAAEKARGLVERLNAASAKMPEAKALDELKYALSREKDPPRLPAYGREDVREGPPGPAEKSLGQAIVESDEFKGFKPGVRQILSWNLPGFDTASLKATLTRTGLTGYDRPAGVVTLGTQRLYVADLLAQGRTTQPVVRYVRETSFTPAATSVAEGAAKPEATFVLSEVDAPVGKVAVWVKVTEEAMEDFTYIASYLDERLRLMVLIEEEDQILNGTGTPPDIRGILQTSGIQTQAKALDSVADAIYKAIVKVRAVGFWEPDGIVINPADMQGLRLAKDTNGQYFGGGPFYTPYAGAGLFTNVNTLWGLPAVETTSIAAGTALVGAFKFGAMRVLRKGVSVEMANQNEDDFKKNLIMIRAEMRLALPVFRPLAFCSVTGLAA